MLSEVDDEGNVTHATTKYDVYGSVNPNDVYGGTDSKHHFVGSLGHTTEPSTGGLIYMRARWYDPVTGRFISEDPAQDGTNWYAYCGGNPANAVDKDGRFFFLFDLLSGSLIGADREGDEAWASSIVYRSNKALVNALSKFNPGIPKWQIGDAVEAAKLSFGMGGAANVAVDKWGGLWTTTGEFMGFITEYL